MWFNSIDFLGFCLIVYPIFYALWAFKQGKGMPRVLFLLAASYFFYMYWNPVYIILLVISTLLDFYCGLLFLKWPREKHRRIVWISVVGGLLILGMFKYAHFAYVNAAWLLRLAGVELPPWRNDWGFTLPPGISFYTFQTMSYTLDIYRGKAVPEKSFWRFALFVTYFPQLVAGPIEKARDLLVQMRDMSRHRPFDVLVALQLIAYGLFKKVAVADSLAAMINPVFAAPGDCSGAMVLTAAVFFSFQIYCDFSGYTDIAMGLARLMGIRLTLNFFFPYFTKNIREFWRCWHITLTSWLKEFLYIPLGGNRHGKVRTYVNLMATMLLGGLWHGASWNFVLWGFLHGLYLSVERSSSERRAVWAASRPTVAGGPFHRLFLAISGAALLGLFNFMLVTLAWIPFRCVVFGDTVASLRQIFIWAPPPPGGPAVDAAYLAACWALVGLLLFFDVFFKLEFHFWKGRPWVDWVRALLLGVFVILTVIFGAEQAQQFIYFRF